jgi:hypothetical protein
MINLSFLLSTITTIIGWRGAPEFQVVERRDANMEVYRTIEVCGTNIRKVFIGSNHTACLAKLQNVYAILVEKGVPNIDYLAFSRESVEDQQSVAYLAPKGMSVYPKTEEELLQAISCVLASLVVSETHL